MDEQNKTATGKKILLVEDDDALANVYTTRLQAEGFDTSRVPNGEDALASATGISSRHYSFRRYDA